MSSPKNFVTYNKKHTIAELKPLLRECFENTQYDFVKIQYSIFPISYTAFIKNNKDNATALISQLKETSVYLRSIEMIKSKSTQKLENISFD